MYISCFSSSFSLFFVLPNEVILSAILFPIKSPVASAGYWTTLFKASIFDASIPVFVAVSINFLPYSSADYLENNKKSNPLTYFLNFGYVEYLIFMSAQ